MQPQSPIPKILPLFDDELPGARIVVGLSGGCDSVALLHALATRATPSAPRSLRAVHVHHGLNTHADDWAGFCASLCARLNVPLEIVHVEVALGPRVSVEAAARKARYAAFHNACGADEIVALAHHADDQIESFLLQLLRGAGVRGLAAMPEYSQASATRPALWRPLLATPQARIRAYTISHGLTHIEDDSNANTRFKRNALRLEVLPAIEAHFPHYRVAIMRSIVLQQAALETVNEMTIPAAQIGPLSLEILKEVSLLQSIERFRRWLVTNALPLPPAARTREAVRQLRAITTDQHFRLQLTDGWELRVIKGKLTFEKTTPNNCG